MHFSDSQVFYATYNETYDRVELQGYDLINDVINEYGTIKIEGRPDYITFDKTERKLYVCYDTRIYGLTSVDAEAKLVANMPVTHVQAGYMLNRDQFVAITTNRCCSVNLDWNTPEAESTIVVSGGILREYEIDHPETQLIEYESLTADEIVAAILTRSTIPDILMINTADTFVYEALKRRGYLLPLTDNRIIECVSMMYPNVQKTVMVNDEIVGLPIAMWGGNVLGYNTEAWRSIGLDKIPSTWNEMVDILNQWPVLSARNSDLSLITEPYEMTFPQQILNAMLSSYEAFLDSADGLKRYDTAQFRELMRLYDSIDFASIESTNTVYGGNRSLLIDDFLWDVGGSMMKAGAPLLLSIAEDEPAVLPASMTVLIVNPCTENPVLYRVHI